MTDATPENQPAPDSGAPDLTVWNDATRDAILEKYGNDTNSLAKGYWHSQQEFEKRGADIQSVSGERADFVQERQTWASEKAQFEAQLEEAQNSAVTAADVNKNVFGAIQDDLVATGEITDETKKALEDLGFDPEFQSSYLDAVKTSIETRFTKAQEFAPEGTDVKALLKFVNEDVAKPAEEALFTAAQLQYFNEALERNDYAGVVPLIEKKYLEATAAAGKKPTKAPTVPEHRNTSSKGAAGPDQFASLADYEAAKADKKYHIDYEYRQEVDRKYRNSDLKRFTDQRMEKEFGPNWNMSQTPLRDG